MPESYAHEDFSRKHDSRGSSDRSFGIVFAVFFTLFGLWRLRLHQPVRWWALGLAGALLIVALVQPVWLRPLNRAWTKLGLLMGAVVSPLVTGLLYLLVVTPTGLLFRLFKKDPLRLDREAGSPSYWIERRPPGPSPETMRNQF
jgi:hypothetical protein